MLRVMNEIAPWWGWLSIAYTIAFIAILTYAVMHAATVSDEWMEQEIPQDFRAWKVSDADLDFEAIVHRECAGTVLVHD